MKAGFIYLLRGEDGSVKIGRSVDPSKRMKAFKNLPFRVALLHMIATDDMVWLEGHLHDRFGHQQIVGEWFRLGDSDLAELRNKAEWNRPEGAEPQPKPFQLRLPWEMREQLGLLAAHNGTDMTAEIRIAIRALLIRERLWPVPGSQEAARRLPSGLLAEEGLWPPPPREGLSAEGVEDYP